MAKENLLSKVYNAEEIQQLLGIGRSKTYDFLDEVNKKQTPFRVIKIGRIYRVPKDSFDRCFLFFVFCFLPSYIKNLKSARMLFMKEARGITGQKFCRRIIA